MRNQLCTLNMGKAVIQGCPPIVAWRSLGDIAQQHIAPLLNKEVRQSNMS